jgi:hypothetical protein
MYSLVSKDAMRTDAGIITTIVDAQVRPLGNHKHRTPFSQCRYWDTSTLMLLLLAKQLM